MWFDRALMLVEVALLIWIVIQGEYIRFYEANTYRIQSNREDERRKWREEKRKQSIKRNETRELVIGDVNNSNLGGNPQ